MFNPVLFLNNGVSLPFRPVLKQREVPTTAHIRSYFLIHHLSLSLQKYNKSLLTVAFPLTRSVQE